MAGKTKSMSQIKQVLLLLKAENAIKQINRITGISRNTIKSYIKKIESLSLSLDQLIVMDDPILENHFRAGNPAYSDDRFDQLQDSLELYIKELKNHKNHLTKKVLWEEYRQVHPNGYGYSQFCYHIGQHLKSKNPTLVLPSYPGDSAMVDYAGDKLSYIDLKTGEIIECQVFVACLHHSDYAFAMAFHTQSLENFIQGIRRFLYFIGGVPRLVIPDNLKSAVVKADRYEPDVNLSLQDMGNHYGFTVVPCRIKAPRDKGSVENQVKLIYQRVYAKLRNRNFYSINELNAAIFEKVSEHNQTRMQQLPFTREERFLSSEKQALNPLPQEPFEIKFHTKLTVAKNCHIYLGRDQHYYSVPYQWISCVVTVLYTYSLVYIYTPDNEMIMYPRSFQKGGYTTRNEHLPSTHQHYLNRSPEYFIKIAWKSGETFGRFMECLFDRSNKPPEQLYNSCDGILSLQRNADKDLFEKACKACMDVEIYSYKFLKNIILNKTVLYPTKDKIKPLPDHTNILGPEYIQQQLEINF